MVHCVCMSKPITDHKHMHNRVMVGCCGAHSALWSDFLSSLTILGQLTGFVTVCVCVFVCIRPDRLSCPGVYHSLPIVFGFPKSLITWHVENAISPTCSYPAAYSHTVTHTHTYTYTHTCTHKRTNTHRCIRKYIPHTSVLHICT